MVEDTKIKKDNKNIVNNRISIESVVKQRRIQLSKSQLNVPQGKFDSPAEFVHFALSYKKMHGC